MQLLERPDGVRVINDAYNANPDSVRAALTTLAGIGRRTGARTVAVLGEMRELGDAASEEHRAVGRLVGELGIDVLVVVGPEAAEIGEGGRRRGFRHSTRRTCTRRWTCLRETVRAPDVVLVKASRGAASNGSSRACSRPTTERSPTDESDPARRRSLPGPHPVGTRLAIRVLAERGYGQLIREDGPTSHHVKRGTPTMGGLVIVLASVARLLPGQADHRLGADRVGAAAALPVRRAGLGRLPRRLHQDLQAAQPRPAQQGEVHRPDRDRGDLRRARAAARARGQPRSRPRPATRSRSSATPTGSRCRWSCW